MMRDGCGAVGLGIVEQSSEGFRLVWLGNRVGSIRLRDTTEKTIPEVILGCRER